MVRFFLLACGVMAGEREASKEEKKRGKGKTKGEKRAKAKPKKATSARQRGATSLAASSKIFDGYYVSLDE